jgi:NitT/TauT family transport system permease protein
MSIAEDRAVPASGAQPVDAEEARRARARRIETIAKWVLPVAIMILTIFLWGWVVRANEIPHFILPGPDRVWDSLVNDWGILIDAAYLTGWITFLALVLAVIGGAGLAILFKQSRLMEMSLYPYAVILQVTPIVAIAPLIFIYVEDRLSACSSAPGLWPSSRCCPTRRWASTPPTTICATCSASTARLALAAASASGVALGPALFPRRPAIAGGLALIGAVVAEYVAGTGGIGPASPSPSWRPATGSTSRACSPP